MDYRKLKADRLFDGYRFLDDKVLIVSTEGIIEDIVASADASPGPLESAIAIAVKNSSTSLAEEQSTNQTPSGKSGHRCHAACTAKCVFPIPPGPVRVIS